MRLLADLRGSTAAESLVKLDRVDGWALGVYMSELQELYTARATGRPAHLQDLPVQYADFAGWQRR